MKELPGESAEMVTKFIVGVLEDNKLDFNNLVSFCADNAPVNFGGVLQRGENNVFKKLQRGFICSINSHLFGLEKTSHLIPVGCPIHILHNSAQKAAGRLTIDIEGIVFALGSYFRGSTQRAEELREFCDFVDVNFSSLLCSYWFSG